MAARLIAAAALAQVALIACAPQSMPVARAMEECAERGRLAAGPQGSIGWGIGSDGPAGRIRLKVSSDMIAGRDPQEVYRQCVFQKSGQLPTAPLLL
jgi:hypothetical protein